MEGDILNLISSVGFPIAMCVYLIWYQNNTLAMLKSSIDKLSTMIDTLKDEIRGLQK